MRQVFFALAFLLSAAVPSLAWEPLKIGQSYSGSIKLHPSNSGIYLALPEGTWVLTSLEQRRDINQGYPLMDGRLVSTDAQKRVTGVISFTAGADANGGWAVPNFCSRKDVMFLQTPATQRRGREIHCWGLYPTGMAQPSANAASYVRDFYQWVHQNNYRLPQSMILVEIYRASGAKYLRSAYYHNPELQGFPRSASATWNKDVVVGDPKRMQYLETLRTWGDQWQPKFEAAFNGRPK